MPYEISMIQSTSTPWVGGQMHPISSSEKEDNIPFEEQNPSLAVTLLTELLNGIVSKICLYYSYTHLVIVLRTIFFAIMSFLKARTKCLRMKYCRDITGSQVH